MRDRYLIGAIFVLGTVTLLDAIYLSWKSLMDLPVFCTGEDLCEVVLTSEYARIAGIPVSVLGVAFSLLILVMFISWLRTKNHTLLFFTVRFALAGAIVAGWLIYIQLSVLNTICTYCMIYDVLTIVMAVLLIIYRVKEHRLVLESKETSSL